MRLFFMSFINKVCSPNFFLYKTLHPIDFFLYRQYDERILSPYIFQRNIEGKSNKDGGMLC